MNQNLEKYTKAELISKLQNIKKESQVNKVNKTEVSNKHTKTTDTILDIFYKIRTLFLSLSIIAILMQIFKKYKSVRAVLRLANYIVLAIFGMSLYEAFGFGFIVRFFGELKYILGSIVSYLSDTTFYSYLMKVFNIEDQNQSVRYGYKKPTEVDWKTEFDKAERQREIEKWKGRYKLESENEDKIDKKMIALLILLLGGSIATWYYGWPEVISSFSPILNLSDLIKKILRGGRDDDDDDLSGNGSIILNNNVPENEAQLVKGKSIRSVSPGIMDYAIDQAKLESDKVDLTPKASSSHLPPAPPAPSVENPPITNQGRPDGLLNQVKSGLKLKKVSTVVKGGYEAYAKADKNNDNEDGMLNMLKNRMSKLRPMMTGDDDELDHVKSNDDWNDKGDTNSLVDNSETMRSVSPELMGYAVDQAKSSNDDNGDTTPTNSLVDKGKTIEKQTSDSANLSSKNSNYEIAKIARRKKFLDIIKSDDNDNNIKASSSKISPALKAISENFPNLSNETLEKLSTPEGIKNREAIINSLPEAELKTNITPLENLIKKGTNVENINELIENDQKEILRETDNMRIDTLIEVINNVPDVNEKFVNSLLDENIDSKLSELITDNPGISKQKAVEMFVQQYPDHKDRILIHVNRTLNRQFDYYDATLSDKELQKEDLKEIQSLSEDRTVDQIKALRAVNRSHNNLLLDIKRKASKSSISQSNKESFDNNSQQFEDTMNLFD
jgi:hypothetical protein